MGGVAVSALVLKLCGCFACVLACAARFPEFDLPFVRGSMLVDGWTAGTELFS